MARTILYFALLMATFYKAAAMKAGIEFEPGVSVNLDNTKIKNTVTSLIADFTGDGSHDVISFDSSTGTFDVAFYNRKKKTFDYLVDQSLPTASCKGGKLYVVRLNTDKLDDLVCLHSNGDVRGWHTKKNINRLPSFTHHKVYLEKYCQERDAKGLQVRNLHWADINNSGYQDMSCYRISKKFDSNNLFFLEVNIKYNVYGMLGENFVSVVEGFRSVPYCWGLMSSFSISFPRVHWANVDGVGNSEFICYSYVIDANEIHMVHRISKFNHYTIQGSTTKDIYLPSFYSPALIDDINGDGLPDLIPRTIEGNVFTIRLGLGTSDFKTVKFDDVFSCPSYYSINRLVDWQNDGYQDALCATIIGYYLLERKPCHNGFSGGLCEHAICSFAKITNSVEFMQSWTKEPRQAVDWNWYIDRDEFSIAQQYEGGKLAVNVQFTPITLDLNQYNLKTGGNRVSEMSGASQDCNSPDKYTFEPHRLQRADAPVGKQITYEVQGIWKSGRDHVPERYWQQDTNVQRDVPQVTLKTFTVKYITQFQVAATDKTGLNTVANVKVEYATNESGPWNKFVMTNRDDGRATITLENPDVPPNTDSAFVYIRASKVSNGLNHDIRYCSNSNSDCDEDFKDGGVVQLDLQHLPETVPTFSIADYSAVPVIGTIQYDWNGISCGVPGVNVTLMTGMTSLSTMETNQNGTFEFTGAVSSNVWLKVEHHDHEFEGEGDTANNLLDESKGVILQDPSTSVLVTIKDVTERTLTLRSGITECKFPFLGHSMKVTAHECASEQTDKTSKLIEMENKRNEMTIQVPAQVFSVEYQFEDGSVPSNAAFTAEDVKERFSDSFLNSDAPNSNQVDLTVHDDAFDFGYHLVPSITTDLEGNYAFKRFPSKCEDKIPDEEKQFDIALNGNSALARFYFFIQESYFDGSEERVCQLTRPGTTIEIKSHLGVVNHECDWANVGEDAKPGCLVQFVDIPDPYNPSQNISASTIALPVGQPEYIGEGETLESVYKSIELKVFNDEIWNMVREEDLTLPPIKVLIVGTEFVSSDSTVSVPERVPLKFLYAPPTANSNKWSYAELTTKVSIQATSKLVDVESNTVGGSVSIGHKFSQKTQFCTGIYGFVCWETVEVSAEVTGTVGTERVMKTFNNDSVTFNSTTDELVLKTPPGQTGDAGDMALLMGVVAKYVRTRLHTFNLDTCKVDYRRETTWDKETDSLLYFSRRDTYGERNKARDTIAVMEENLMRNDLSGGEIEEYKELKMKAEAAVTQWNSLLAFWQKDMLEAESFPVAVGGVIVDASDATYDSSTPNMINIGSGVVTIKETREDSRDELTDYTVYTHDASFDVDASGSASFFGIGLTWGVKAAYTHSWDFERTVRDSEATTSTYTAVLHESDPEDNVAIQVFRSPFSKTFVYKTFGGLTRCPHLPGTDAHQKVEIEMGELNTEDGYIVLEVSTKRMENFASGAKQSIDLVMSLDSDAATMPIGFTIGSATLNQPFLFTMGAGETQSVYVFYERSLETLNRLTVTGNIKSECDSSVMAPFAFTLSWETPCAAIGWGGSLQDPLDSWVLSNAEPELELTFINEGEVQWDTIPQLKFSIWYLNQSRKGSQWEELPAEYYGDISIEDLEETDAGTGISSATISINAETVSDVLDSNQVYLLEARASCPGGDSRSGPRQGLVDYESPRIESWKFVRSPKMFSKAIEVAGIMFSEPIDCVHDDLKATVKISSESSETVATVLCAANAYMMGVYVRVDDTADLARWSNSTVELTILGIHDLSGNKFDDALGALSKEFTPAPGVFSRAFQMPVYDGGLSNDLNEWTPDASIAVTTQHAVASGRALVLPEANINTFSTISEPETALGGGTVAGIVGGSVVVAAIIAGVVVYRLKSKHSEMHLEVEAGIGDSKLSFVPSAMELESGDVKLTSDNPMFGDSPAMA